MTSKKEGEAWERGGGMGTRGRHGDEGEAWGRGGGMATRGRYGDEGEAWGRGGGIGTRGRHGDEATLTLFHKHGVVWFNVVVSRSPH